MTVTGAAVYSDRYADALACAATWHAAQRRKNSDVPYVAHLISVSALVWRYGGDEDAAIAGLLHDAVEDTGGLPRAEEIRERFGELVHDIVMAATDSTSADPDAKAPWRERKEHHIAVATALAAAGQVRPCVVMACDKLDNVLDILRELDRQGPVVWSAFKASPADSVWYYRSMLDALAPALPADLVATYRDAVERLDVAAQELA